MAATTFSDMPTLGASRTSVSPPFHQRRRSLARRIERCCCMTLSYFPLVFVYGLTTWGVYVDIDVSFVQSSGWYAFLRAGVGIALYLLANISYTIAVFTSPGSPLDQRRDSSKIGRRKIGGYEGLPMHEDDEDSAEGAVPREWMTMVTAKSTGQPRYCKKCRSVKPDRSHHCSTCGRCVLKMDHHCPWLATCVGLRNYKAFLLFLTYVSLFCWGCFANTATWVYIEITDSHAMEQGLRVINVVMLAVLSGIIGLVLSGFAGWHYYLAVTGQTTIESLEKTRYLTSLRQAIEPKFQGGRNYVGDMRGDTALASEDQPLSERLKEIHANALPGVLRSEEGDTTLEPSLDQTRIGARSPAYVSPAKDSLQRSYASMEAQRERDRYNSYLDEQDSEKLPNAFDNGWRRNLLHVFGQQPLLWAFPVCNTSCDGWDWEISTKWHEARDRVARAREQRDRENAAWDRQPGHPHEPPKRQPDWKWTLGKGFVDQSSQGLPTGPPRTNGGVPMQPLDRRKASPGISEDFDEYSTSSDEDARLRTAQETRHKPTTNWNDVPEDFLTPKQGQRERSRGRHKGD